jgi:hypothetical protein
VRGAGAAAARTTGLSGLVAFASARFVRTVVLLAAAGFLAVAFLVEAAFFGSHAYIPPLYKIRFQYSINSKPSVNPELSVIMNVWDDILNKTKDEVSSSSVLPPNFVQKPKRAQSGR